VHIACTTRSCPPFIVFRSDKGIMRLLGYYYIGNVRRSQQAICSKWATQNGHKVLDIIYEIV